MFIGRYLTNNETDGAVISRQSCEKSTIRYVYLPVRAGQTLGANLIPCTDQWGTHEQGNDRHDGTTGERMKPHEDLTMWSDKVPSASEQVLSCLL